MATWQTVAMRAGALLLTGSLFGALATYLLACVCIPLASRLRRDCRWTRPRLRCSCRCPPIVGRCLMAVWQFFWQPAANDLLVKKAFQVARQRAVSYFKTLCKVLVHFAAYGLIWDVLAGRFDDLVKVAGGEEPCDSLSFVDVRLRRLVFFCLMLFVETCPNRVTTRTPQIFQVAMALYICLRVASTEDIRVLRDHEALDVASSICLAVLAGGPILTLILATSCSIVRVGMYNYFLGQSSEEELQELMSLHGQDHATRFVVEHVVTALAIVFLGSALDNAMLEAAMASLREQVTSQIQQIAQSLLAVLCDAVVSTDAEFLLTESCLSLANMLEWGTPGNCYEGQCFLDFVDKADRVRVQNHFTQALASLGTAQSITTKLINGADRPVDMRLYCVAFDDLYGRRRNVIGIKELEGARGDVVPVRSSTAMYEAFQSNRSKTSKADISEDHSVGSNPTSTLSNSELLQESEAFIDIKTASLVTWNPAFTMVTGPEQEAGCSFEDWLIEAQPGEVLKIMQVECAT
eukprot:TRINITY_DN20873_c0_g1_i2.p1 TRINITY_DN20873_c0_g1~~TRINITY_DN20873_c0_g1_i2.p1  ORF type:complete len:521 (+),score=81.47 TRINITY_DN20873_c0_g1_i2:127-1689(+)